MTPGHTIVRQLHQDHQKKSTFAVFCVLAEVWYNRVERKKQKGYRDDSDVLGWIMDNKNPKVSVNEKTTYVIVFLVGVIALFGAYILGEDPFWQPLLLNIGSSLLVATVLFVIFRLFLLDDIQSTIGQSGSKSQVSNHSDQVQQDSPAGGSMQGGSASRRDYKKLLMESQHPTPMSSNPKIHRD